MIYRDNLQRPDKAKFIKYEFYFIITLSKNTPLRNLSQTKQLSDYTTLIHYSTPIDQADRITSKVGNDLPIATIM